MEQMVKRAGWSVAAMAVAVLVASGCSILDSSASSPSGQGAEPVPEEPSATASSEADESGYQSVIAAPGQISLHWKNSQDESYGLLERLRQDLEQQGKNVRLVTNAGIFGDALTPAGLHVEGGSELRPINLLDGEGNFQLLPNGVFYIVDGAAGVLESNAYVAAGIQPRLAVQSGPQLLADGVIHPEFSETSDNREFRNGLGLTADGQVLFMQSTRPVTFWDFSTEFLERGVTNALYLDGGNHSVWDEPVEGEPLFPNLPIAGMLAVTE